MMNDYNFSISPWNFDFPGFNQFNSNFFNVIWPLIVSIFFIIIASIIVMYVFQALALYTMARNRNFPRPWLAWIPIAQSYVMGAVINDEVTISTLKIPYAKIILPSIGFASAAAMMIFNQIPFLGTLLSIAVSLASRFIIILPCIGYLTCMPIRTGLCFWY